MQDDVKNYISELNKLYATGVAREHAYRVPLQVLLTALLPKGYTIVNEPARIACGAPDYIILRGDAPVAFFEAKDLDDRDLDGNREHKEQFERYKNSLNNIVFTDYLDFHLYIGGEFQDAIRLAEIRGNKIVAIESNVEPFIQMISRLVNSQPQKITSPVRLAKVMASKARMLAQVIEKALDNDVDGITELSQQMRVFQEYLIHDLNKKTFADIYAQTIAYGLFSARLNDPTPEDFSRGEANELIPKSNPLLRRIFNDIAGYNVDRRIEWIVDDLVEAFRVTDMATVMKDFGEATKRNDPMMHFYEDFLNQYDPQTKAQRGVYYTPQPVVDFIVRAVDDILKRDFNLPMGLADNSMIEHEVINDQYTGKKGDSRTIKKRIHRVQILDPATGTGTFLATVIRQIHSNMEGQLGAWNSYVEQHLIPRLNGFELMMASYTIAHLKLSMVLHETGFTQQSDKRLRVYLTNSLEEHNADTGTLFSAAISNESYEASHIKRDTPVMVMIGNPPYSGESHNKGSWIMSKMESYKFEPGGKIPLQERNPKWINDDYVKFIRLAQDYVERNGNGIVAFINPHGYLDNPTFRGMRWNLLETFDSIYTLDLHGNGKKKETTPDGGKDENVFDIMQGVSINLFVKTGKKAKGELGKVYHKDLFGLRQDKYVYLDNANINSVGYHEITPTEPMYFFVPKNFELDHEYNQNCFGINELFVENSVGIVTTKDDFVICDNEEEVSNRVADIINMTEEELRKKYKLTDTADWTIKGAKADAGEQIDKSKIFPITYRPFDKKYLYYTGKTKGFVARSRYSVLHHLLSPKNIGLVIGRQGQVVGKMQWNLVFITKGIVDFNAYYRGGGCTFPLFLVKDNMGLEELIPNFNKSVLSQIEQFIEDTVDPYELLDYIYAVLHSSSYRERYKEFLKVDFPRIPYPTTAEEYHRLSAIGSQLRKLHLMEEVPVTKHAQFNTAGSNVVDKPEYKDGCVWINKEQCFEDVPETAWNFYIGGYQPAQKWLKDRKGRELTFDDIAHYRKIVSVLEETDRLMKEIDKE